MHLRKLRCKFAKNIAKGPEKIEKRGHCHNISKSQRDTFDFEKVSAYDATKRSWIEAIVFENRWSTISTSSPGDGFIKFHFSKATINLIKKTPMILCHCWKVFHSSFGYLPGDLLLYTAIDSTSQSFRTSSKKRTLLNIQWMEKNSKRFKNVKIFVHFD